MISAHATVRLPPEPQASAIISFQVHGDSDSDDNDDWTSGTEMVTPPPTSRSIHHVDVEEVGRRRCQLLFSLQMPLLLGSSRCRVLVFLITLCIF